MKHSKIIYFSILLSSFISITISAQQENWKSFYSGREISSIISKGKNLYAGTNSGFVHVNLETDEVKLFDKYNTNGQIGKSNVSYIDTNGNIYLDSDNAYGWHQFDINFKCYLVSNLTCAAVDKNGDSWLGTKSSGIDYSKYDPKYNAHIFNWLRNSNSPLPSDNIRSLFLDKDQNLWILCYNYDRQSNSNGGLVKFDGTNWTIYDKTNSPLPTYELNAMTFDKNGDIWIGTDYYGLLKFSNGKWTRYEIKLPAYSEFKYADVTSVAVDSSNNIWVGTRFTGLFKFDGITWKAYDAYNSILHSSFINAVTVDYKNRIWIGTEIGLFRLDGDSLKEYNTSNSPLPNYQFLNVASDSKNNIWILNQDYGSPLFFNKSTAAITKYDGQNFTVNYIYDFSKSTYGLYCMTIDQNDNVWVVTNNGLCKYDGDKWKLYEFSFSSKFQSQRICADVLNNIWIGTYYGNIVKFDGSKFTVYLASDNGLPSTPITAMTSPGSRLFVSYDSDDIIYQIDISKVGNKLNVKRFVTPAKNIFQIKVMPKGEIWIASYSNGIYKFDGSTWTNYNIDNSALPTNLALTIDVDNNGRIVVTCDDSFGYSFKEGGVAFFDGNKWEKFTYGNSMLGPIFTYGSIFDKKGNIWIYGNGAVTVFNPQGINSELIKESIQNSLSQNFPNPTNGSTFIKYSLAFQTNVIVKIYDLLGKELITLVNDIKPAGNYSTYWDGKDKFGKTVASGIYLYSLITKEGIIAKKLIWLK